MDGIYSLLSKHFFGETTDIEELQITEFKTEKRIEYQMLSELIRVNKLSRNKFEMIVRVISEF